MNGDLPGGPELRLILTHVDRAMSAKLGPPSSSRSGLEPRRKSAPGGLIDLIPRYQYLQAAIAVLEHEPRPARRDFAVAPERETRTARQVDQAIGAADDGSGKGPRPAPARVRDEPDDSATGKPPWHRRDEERRREQRMQPEPRARDRTRRLTPEDDGFCGFER